MNTNNSICEVLDLHGTMDRIDHKKGSHDAPMIDQSSDSESWIN